MASRSGGTTRPLLLLVLALASTSCNNAADTEPPDRVGAGGGGAKANGQSSPARSGSPATSSGQSGMDATDPPTPVSAAGEGGAASELGGAGSELGGTAATGEGGTAMAQGGAPQGGAGAAQGGAAGAGGAPDGLAVACLSCASSSCASTLTACSGNPECAPWLACVRGCSATSCSDACDARYSDVARVYRGVYGCLCNAPCASDCGFLQACSKQTCNDGAPAPSSTVPRSLAETGLYVASSSASGTVYQMAPDVRGYEPAHALWADGAGKDRFISVPRCATIDTSDMDHWQFPVGTRLWKHFELDGKRLETRFMLRYGSSNDDWLLATFAWDAAKPDDPAAALPAPQGVSDAQGTLHDIPDSSACPSCHGKLPEKPLGFSAIELSHGGDGITLQKLSDWGMLSVPARQGFAVPGTPVQQAALGYLHANCGGCHNAFGKIPRENPMILRLSVSERSYADTGVVKTAIGVPTINSYPELHDKPRIAPGSPETSAIFLRMSDRNKFPMPPLATKFPDTAGGVAAVRTWIESLPK